MKLSSNFNIVLYQPEIPPNTGNIIRLCANTGCRLHLIKPLGFSIQEKSLRRAGLDHSKNVEIIIYQSFKKFIEKNSSNKIHVFTKYGDISYEKVNYRYGDFLFFGSETSGLSDEVFKTLKKRKKIFIPMLPNSRSINLANSVSICVYEAWRQNNFDYLRIVK